MNFLEHHLIFLILILSISAPLKAQQLDVEGQSRVRGKLDIGHMVDSASVVIGLGAGINTDFSENDSINMGPSLTFIGAYAGHLNTQGFYNTATGFRALYSNTIGKNNTANGVFSLENNQTGISNTAVGAYALNFNQTGGANTAMGASTLEFNTSGSGNTGIGNHALRKNTIGYYNTASGAGALSSNTTGYFNTSTGYAALLNNQTGVSNTSTGYEAMYKRKTGAGNTATGVWSLFSDSIGSNNTSVGYQALYYNESGSQNTALGSNAYFTGNNLSNTTCIGYNSGRMSSMSNRIEIGNSSVSWIGGQVTWSTYSDRRIKKRIQENVPGLSFIKRLRPVTYFLDIHGQNDMSHQDRKIQVDWDEKYLIEETLMTGFIAQEVDEVARSINYSFSGVHKATDTLGIYSLRYAEFVVPLVKAVQEQQDMIEILLAEKENAAQLLHKIVNALSEAGISLEDHFTELENKLTTSIVSQPSM